MDSTPHWSLKIWMNISYVMYNIFKCSCIILTNTLNTLVSLLSPQPQAYADRLSTGYVGNNEN